MTLRSSALIQLASFRDDQCDEILSSIDSMDTRTCQNELGGLMSFKVNGVPSNCMGRLARRGSEAYLTEAVYLYRHYDSVICAAWDYIIGQIGDCYHNASIAPYSVSCVLANGTISPHPSTVEQKLQNTTIGGPDSQYPLPPNDPYCDWPGHCLGSACPNDSYCADPWPCVCTISSSHTPMAQ